MAIQPSGAAPALPVCPRCDETTDSPKNQFHSKCLNAAYRSFAERTYTASNCFICTKGQGEVKKCSQVDFHYHETCIDALISEYRADIIETIIDNKKTCNLKTPNFKEHFIPNPNFSYEPGLFKRVEDVFLATIRNDALSRTLPPASFQLPVPPMRSINRASSAPHSDLEFVSVELKADKALVLEALGMPDGKPDNFVLQNVGLSEKK